MGSYLKYKDYTGTVEFSAEDEVFHGKIFGIKDLVTFEGRSVEEIKHAFEESVDEKLETCKEIGKTPEKLFKGSFNVRVPSSVHKDAALVATQYNMSLNDFVKLALTYAINHQQELSKELRIVH